MSLTREQLKKHWDVIEAFKNGSHIQFLNQDNEWECTEFPRFSESRQYRIKTEPKCVPFDFSDAEKIIGKAIKSNLTGSLSIIVYVSNGEVISGSGKSSFNSLFLNYTFLDGTPCGKIAEQ